MQTLFLIRVIRVNPRQITSFSSRAAWRNSAQPGATFCSMLDLHNGLTNSLQLAEADDLQASPWLGVIFDEVLNSTRVKPLSGAVRFSQLKPIGATCAGAVALVVAIVLISPAPFAHGWRQLFSP